MKKKKEKNYKLRSKVYGGIGGSVFATSTIGAFVGYEVSTDWSNFKNDFSNFMVVQPETMKLNIAIAFPALISILIFTILWRKKHKKQLETNGNISFGILIALLVVYALYSIIEVSLVTLAGAFIGSFLDEKIFAPLSRSAKLKYQDDHEVNLEYRKEKVRRKIREDDLSGTV